MHAGIPLDTARGLTREEAAAIVQGLANARRREAAAADAAMKGMG